MNCGYKTSCKHINDVNTKTRKWKILLVGKTTASYTELQSGSAKRKCSRPLERDRGGLLFMLCKRSGPQILMHCNVQVLVACAIHHLALLVLNASFMQEEFTAFLNFKFFLLLAAFSLSMYLQVLCLQHVCTLLLLMFCDCSI